MAITCSLLLGALFLSLIFLELNLKVFMDRVSVDLWVSRINSCLKTD